MRLYREQAGCWVELGPALAAGGEGEVRSVTGAPTLLAKVLFPHAATPERAAKVALLARWPERDPRVAWPVDRLATSPGGPFRGLLVPYFAECVNWFESTNPAARRARGLSLSPRDRVGVARDLADLVAAVHGARLILADVLNPHNLLVALHKGRPADGSVVRAIDADSVEVQARDSTGRMTTMRCGVGQPNYLPPELLGKNLRATDRTRAADAFAVAILAWEVLKDAHPFAAAGPRLPPVRDRVKAGTWPWDHTRTLPPGWRPVDDGIPVADFPAAVRDVFFRTFVCGHTDPSTRPAPAELRDELDRWLSQMRTRRRWWPRVRIPSPRPVIRFMGRAARAVWEQPIVQNHRGPVAAGIVFAALAVLRTWERPAQPTQMGEPVPPVTGAPPTPATSRLETRVRPDAIPGAPALWRAALTETGDGKAYRR